MSIKGFPSQKKLTTELAPYTDKQSFTTNEFVTAQPSYSDKMLFDTVSASLTRIHSTVKTAAANTVFPKRVLKNTSHGASKGDVIRFQLASANPYFEATIISVPDANTMILGAELPNNIVTGDEFYILRHVTPRVADDGTLIATLAAAPIQFVKDGTDTEVSVNTTTLGSSEPLPVLNMSAFVPKLYDEVALTYVAAGNGVGQIQTAVYKLATVTVRTLTLSYDGSNRLSGVVAV